MLKVLMNQGYSESEAKNLIRDMCSNVHYDMSNGKSEFSAIEDELLQNGLDLDYEIQFIQIYGAWLTQYEASVEKKTVCIDGVEQKIEEEEYNIEYGDMFKLSYSDGLYRMNSTELEKEATYCSISDLLEDLDTASRWMKDNWLTTYFSVKENEVWTYNEQIKHKIEVYLVNLALSKNGQLEFNFN